MKTRVLLGLLVGVFCLSPKTDAQGLWQSPIREIARFDLPDVAMASFDTAGPVVYYNPTILAKVGPLAAAFFRAHEYGHHHQGHLKRLYFEANPYNRTWVQQRYEREADCYAAKTFARTNPEVNAAAATLFASLQGPNRPDWYHPTGYERAAVIESCSQQITVEAPAETPNTLTVTDPCNHPAHPEGDRAPCVHAAHPQGDQTPCVHVCMNIYGMFMPCHAFDVQPCSHPAHPLGDAYPCVHPAHPEGHQRQPPAGGQ